MLTNKLEEIGLSDKEAKVYIAVLELGEGSASEIAKKSGVNRATVYFTLENLMKLGLVSATNEEKKQKFVPEDPSQLENIITKQQQELEQKKKGLKDVVEELNSINSASIKKPIVKYYLGKEGIMRMAMSSFDDVRDDIMWLAFSKDEMMKFISEEENTQIANFRKNKNIKAEVLYNWKDDVIKNNETTNALKVDTKEYFFPADISVYKNKIRLTSYKDQIGIIIENKSIAETLKSIFRLAIKSAQNKNS